MLQPEACPLAAFSNFSKLGDGVVLNNTGILLGCHFADSRKLPWED